MRNVYAINHTRKTIFIERFVMKQYKGIRNRVNNSVEKDKIAKLNILLVSDKLNSKREAQKCIALYIIIILGDLPIAAASFVNRNCMPAQCFGV